MTLSELAAEMRRTVDAGVFNGQIVLHVANGEVVKVEATTVARVKSETVSHTTLGPSLRP